MQKTVLDSTTYEIPIEDFERDMNTESSKDKKEKILDFFFFFFFFFFGFYLIVNYFDVIIYLLFLTKI